MPLRAFGSIHVEEEEEKKAFFKACSCMLNCAQKQTFRQCLGCHSQFDILDY